MRLSACVVIFADGTLLRDVTITIVDGKIYDIANGIDPDVDCYAVVTPMFHNGHSHTEYQLLGGQLAPGPFFAWVRDVVRLKRFTPQRLWGVSTLIGVTKLMEMGYASTDDCNESGFSAGIMAAFGLRGTSYREVNGLMPDDTSRCSSIIDDVHGQSRDFSVGIAPHAIYSTSQAVIDSVREQAGTLPLCIHVDESPEEDLFCRFDNGPFMEMYRRRNIEHKSPHMSAVQYFDSQGLVTENTLLVHGCNWTPDDIAIVKSRNACVALCPESNVNLKCNRPPVELLFYNDIPTVIGTDSSLSCESMSPIVQLKCLMSMASDPNLHRWLFHSQVTTREGLSYDVKVGSVADFCAFGHGKTTRGRTLSEIVDEIADLVPVVFRSGHVMTKKQHANLEVEVASILHQLSTQ